MRFSDLSLSTIHHCLRTKGVVYQCGPFTIQLKANIPSLAAQIHNLFAHYPFINNDVLINFQVNLVRPHTHRYWWRPQVQFKTAEGDPGMAPFPLDHALPMLEWGTNWCIASQSHFYLMLHSAVVEYLGKGVLLPAWPGSGKSTLCAAFAMRGWRMLSDEFGLIDLETGLIQPLPKLIPLKNQSIEVIRNFAPDAVIGPLFTKTRKGDVAHFRPPLASVAQSDIQAKPRLVIFPKYQPDTRFKLIEVTKAQALLRLANNAFNYQVVGKKGFQAVKSLIDQSSCYELYFNDLDTVIENLQQLIKSLPSEE
ncbi:HprK-related kinase A [Zooshikella marina]|uniref:HprK-related kinase A n=1 Tax=Zooshikella ganghwensis TaxID=202772 RepID=UPI001BAE5E68|nr:HprK-related kinase A [Zooshikella ganghwensis]MBU2708166.1 HprK-related kinase A [Zooshikella ganghwensis]